MRRKSSSNSTTLLAGCLPIIALILFNISMGMMSVNYILGWFGKNIPWFGDMVIGLFVAEFSVPIAIAGWILRLCGVF